MYWLFADETNLEPAQGDFFIYGGLIMTPEQMTAADAAIADIRSAYGLKPDEQLKFQTKGRPSRYSPKQWNEAKAEVIQAAGKIGVQMLVYVILHAIAKGKKPDERIGLALNATITRFNNGFLKDHDDVGVVCVDRLKESFGFKYLRQLFQQGNDFGQLNRVIHYSMSCDGASHISSMVDIALGGFRYCVNAAGDENGNPDTAKKIIPPLGDMMWHVVNSKGEHQVGGYGYIPYPKVINHAPYKKKYDDLAARLTEWTED